MMMMKIDESKLSNYFEFINARGFDFFASHYLHGIAQGCI